MFGRVRKILALPGAGSGDSVEFRGLRFVEDEFPLAGTHHLGAVHWPHRGIQHSGVPGSPVRVVRSEVWREHFFGKVPVCSGCEDLRSRRPRLGLREGIRYRDSRNFGRALPAGQFRERGKQVARLQERIGAQPGSDPTGRPPDHGYVEQRIVQEHAFADHAVVAHEIPVIRGQDHHRSIRQAAALQPAQQSTQRLVHAPFDLGVVVAHRLGEIFPAEALEAHRSSEACQARAERRGIRAVR